LGKACSAYNSSGVDLPIQVRALELLAALPPPLEFTDDGNCWGCGDQKREKNETGESKPYKELFSFFSHSISFRLTFTAKIYHVFLKVKEKFFKFLS